MAAEATDCGSKKHTKENRDFFCLFFNTEKQGFLFVFTLYKKNVHYIKLSDLILFKLQDNLVPPQFLTEFLAQTTSLTRLAFC